MNYSKKIYFTKPLVFLLSVFILLYAFSYSADAKKKPAPPLTVKVYKKTSNSKKKFPGVLVSVVKVKNGETISSKTTGKTGIVKFSKLAKAKYSVSAVLSGFTFTPEAKKLTLKNRRRTIIFMGKKNDEPVVPMTKPKTAVLKVNTWGNAYFDFSIGTASNISGDIFLGGIFFGSNFIPSLYGAIVEGGGKSWKDETTAPENGYDDNTSISSLKKTAVYFVRTKEGKYAKFLVRNYGGNGYLVMDWMYQSDGTKEFPDDETSPVISSVTPSESEESVPLTTEFAVKFDEPITGTYLLNATISGKYSPQFSFEPIFDYENNSIKIPYGYNLAPDEVYTVTIKSQYEFVDNYVTDISGNQLILDKTWSFKTASANTDLTGKILYHHYFDDEFWIMDANGTRETFLKDREGKYIIGHMLSPDRKKLLYSVWPTGTSSNVDLELLNLVNGDTTVLATGLNMFFANYDFSPSGDRIVYSPSDGIYIYDISGSSTSKISSVYGAGVNWSKAEGSEDIVFRYADNSNISRIDALTNVITTTYDGSGYGPVYSPDGSKIAFLEIEEDDNRIQVMNADGSGKTKLTESTTGEEYSPVWSPDGSRIAFIRDDKLYVINSDGTGETELADSSFESTRQSNQFWSPDGTYIVFTGYREDLYGDFYFDIYAVKSDGTGSDIKLTSHGDSRTPVWFTPAADSDITTPPNVITTTVSEGETGVPYNLNLKVTFSKFMVNRDVEEYLSFSPASEYPLFTNFSWDGNSVVVSNDNSLLPNTPYTLTIGANALDIFNKTLDGDNDGSAEGSPVDDFVLHFTTGN